MACRSSASATSTETAAFCAGPASLAHSLTHEGIADLWPNGHRKGMDQQTRDALQRTIVRLPDWIRHDLGGKDAALRLRAEEALVAMLVDVLNRASGKDD